METASRKPYLMLSGEAVLLRAVRRLRASRGCGEVIVVVHPEDYEAGIGEELCNRLAELDVRKVTRGGATRQESVLAGLRLVDEQFPLVLIHDGVRPLVTATVVERVAAEAERTGAAIAAVRVVATAKDVGTDGTIQRTLSRDGLWLAQTPQGFHRELILRAHLRAREDGFVGTDDSELVERLGLSVSAVEDRSDNIKITTLQDLAVAEAVLRWQAEREQGAEPADRQSP